MLDSEREHEATSARSACDELDDAGDEGASGSDTDAWTSASSSDGDEVEVASDDDVTSEAD